MRDWAIDALTELADDEADLYTSRHSSVPLVRENPTGLSPTPNPVGSDPAEDSFQKDTEVSDEKSGTV